MEKNGNDDCVPCDSSADDELDEQVQTIDLNARIIEPLNNSQERFFG